jgi:tetratricopeptide (TPR) repeat protein
LDPASPLGWTARGNAYFLLGRYDEALSDLLHAQRLDPDNADTRELAAKAQAMVDELVSRARATEVAPETGTVVLPGAPEPAPKPEARAARKAAAPAATAPGPAPAKPAATAPAPAPAKPLATAPASAAPQVPPVAPAPAPAPAATAAEYHTRGRKFLQDDRYEEAIQQLTEALKLDPSLTLAYNARGFAHFRLKQYAEAIADFDEAIRLNPSYLNAYVNRSAARRAAGDRAGADADQAKARELMQGRK